jgi:hypothetical protein
MEIIFALTIISRFILQHNAKVLVFLCDFNQALYSYMHFSFKKIPNTELYEKTVQSFLRCYTRTIGRTIM